MSEKIIGVTVGTPLNPAEIKKKMNLESYATENYVKEYAQPKGEYLTEVPSGYAKTSEIPTKTSQLNNDSGFVTNETDPTVPSWAKQSSKPSYSKAEVGLGNVDNVKQYSANNPPPYPVTSVNGKTGAVSITVPTVPTNVSAFTNDAGYLTQHQDISGKLDASKLPEAIDTALAQAKASGEFDGDDGQDGQRGTGILKVTTTPTSYTTTTAGVTPVKRMSLATIKSEANVDEVLVGDQISHSYYLYRIYYTDATYAYMDKSQSIRGATGSAGAAGTSVTVSGVTESTESGGSNVVNFSDGKTVTIKNGSNGKDAYEYAIDGGYKGSKVEFASKLAKPVPSIVQEAGESETLVMSQKAVTTAIAEVKAQDTQATPLFADSVEWLNENGDTTKPYVLPDGYIYAYMTKTEYIEHNVYDGTDNTLLRNYRVTGLETQTAHSGSVATYKIPVDTSWPSCVVTFKGINKLYVIDYAPFYVYYYDKDGNQIVRLDPKKYGLTDNNQAELAVPEEGLSFNIALATYNGTTVWPNTAYVRLEPHISSSAVYIDSPLLNTLVINIAPLNESVEVTSWSNTGHMFNTDQYGAAIEQNALNITTLQTDVAALKNKTNNMLIPSNTVWYAIGDSITAGYGVGNTSASEYDNSASWVRYVLDYNGYNKGHSLNLGLPGLGFCRESYGHTARTLVNSYDFSAVDLVTIALGINDWKTVYSLDTMQTEMRYCFEKILTDNPYCKIVFIAPFNISKVGSFETNWALGYSGSNVTGGITLQAFIDIQRTICEEYGVQMVDINKDGIINKRNINTVLYDTIHPDEACHKALGRELARRIMFA